MNNLIIFDPQNRAIQSNGNLAQAGAAADELARESSAADYAGRKADNTKKRHKVDLKIFAEYLKSAGVTLDCEDFQTDLTCWRGVTWGLVFGFREWQLQQGYAVGSVNVRLTTVKAYAKLAFDAGEIEQGQYLAIKGVKGYSQKEGRNKDKERTQTRKTRADGVTAVKKAESIVLSPKQFRQLLNQPDTEQGRRDKLLMYILVRYGLRCGEAALLKVGGFNLETGHITFHRPKVDKWQTHKLDAETLAAAKAYFEYAPTDPTAPVFRSSNKSGKLTHAGMTERAITKRVKELGERIGVEGLSAHDLRHTWATDAAANETPLEKLQWAGGWDSPSRPLTYIKKAKIANEGVKQSSLANFD